MCVCIGRQGILDREKGDQSTRNLRIGETKTHTQYDLLICFLVGMPPFVNQGLEDVLQCFAGHNLLIDAFGQCNAQKTTFVNKVFGYTIC